ncbi:MAG: hypothetical protein EBY49_05635, partial [Actinobacteria bacterium]|nr:hypothetical protein [Actinomycetota bacterium]
SSGLPNTAETQRRITPQVLRGLIDEALQTEEAERLNVRVTQGEIDSAVGRIEQNNNIPRGGFETFLRRQGISLEAATDQMHAADLDVLTDDERADLRDLAKAARVHQG